jgi:hypothetical protein
VLTLDDWLRRVRAKKEQITPAVFDSPEIEEMKEEDMSKPRTTTIASSEIPLEPLKSFV